MSDAVPVKTLLITVFDSVVEVFILCVAGYTLSRAGVTDKATQRKLNVINVSLFTPALLFSKVAYSLTPAKLKEMWIIPLGFVIVTSLSAAVAWILSKAFGLKRSQTAFAICAAMFQNSNSLPIALIQSLVVEVPHLKWGADDSKDQMLGRALTYLVLYSTLGMMLRWSWGVKLLSHADDEVPDIESARPHPPDPASALAESPSVVAPHPGARETDPFFSTARGISRDEMEDQRNLLHSAAAAAEGLRSRDTSPVPSNPWISDPGSAHSMHRSGSRRHSAANVPIRQLSSASTGAPSKRKPLTRTESGRVFWGLPEMQRAPKDALPVIGDEEDSSGDDSDEEHWEAGSLRRRMKKSSRISLRSVAQSAQTKIGSALRSVNAFMTVPMYAAIVSIVIAMIPPLQAALVKIKPVEQAIRGAGACSIPVTLVVLGAFFYTPPQPATGPVALPEDKPDTPLNASNHSLGGYIERKFRNLTQRPTMPSRAYPGENKTVFVAIISRMIVVPLLTLPIIGLLAKYDLFKAAEDPVFILSAVLLVSSPPALTLAQITQAASGDAFERLISKTISWSYAILTPPLTLAYVVIGLVFGRW